MRITKISQLPWKPEGLIIDPYAGHKRWWKGTEANVVFVDKFFQEPGVIAADASALPFADATFDQAWCDPPHLIRKSPFKPTSRFYKCSGLTADRPSGYFGTYPTRDDLRKEWTAVAKELHRVVKPFGTMVWKSIDKAKTVSQCCNYEDLECLRPHWILVGEVRYPSVMTWSTAETIYTLWERV